MRIDFELLQEAIESGEQIGFCLSCGAERDMCEPDAQHYECEGCGEKMVFGAEEIVLMGKFKYATSSQRTTT